jgi:hypothetical protein
MWRYLWEKSGKMLNSCFAVTEMKLGGIGLATFIIVYKKFDLQKVHWEMLVAKNIQEAIAIDYWIIFS